MSTVYERDLIPRLSREVGDVDSNNLYYSTNQLFSALNDGIEDLNEEMFQQYSVIGTGDNAYYSPEPDDREKRLIVLFSARALLRGELIKSARTAIVHSNPAGRTDMSKRPEALKMAIDIYTKKINRIKVNRARKEIDDKLDDVGSMELKSTNNTDRTSPEGLTTIQIIESV